jgi:Bardet-Biedl syndrome 7 protein
MFMDSEVVRRGWKLPSESKVSTVECMEATVDQTKDGMLDLTLGRDDGSVEVYTLMDDGTTPRKVFEKNVNESITMIATGYVTDSTVEDIVLSTFSGKVFFTTHHLRPTTGLFTRTPFFT